jgi:hypothetical protein
MTSDAMITKSFCFQAKVPTFSWSIENGLGLFKNKNKTITLMSIDERMLTDS